ncbi:MAG: D-tyrosyl-tRNA(Tyr) deacylase [Proteobacteria bacterium]|nr:D-tyrosyl-tRNA(Tyr) deacylase [Pseudomonadota bacterium]
MRALVQRVTSASVAVDGETAGEKIAEIGTGLLVLVCAMRGDDDAAADYLAGKIAKLRIFADENAKTNLSIHDVGGKVLVVSQFTLAAEWRKGNRPGFSRAAPPEEAERLYDLFCEKLRDAGLEVATGRFAAMMQVSLVGDGPFTLWMDTAAGA